MPAPVGSNDNNIIFETGTSETERLALQHEIIKDHMKDLIKAPLDLSKPGLKILDQATADGIWLKDVAAVAPAQHEYVGTDIVDSYYPNPPPPHTKFFSQSMTADWPAELQGTFDLVHSRLALPGAGTNPPRDVVQRLVDLVKPGGFIQQIEMVFTQWPKLGPAMKDLHQASVDVFSIAVGGQDLHYMKALEKWYAEMGLEDIHSEVYTIPIGAKAETERMRQMSIESFTATSQSLSETAKVMPPISVSPEKLATLPTRLRQELTEVGGTWQVFAIWAHKKA
ncbi:hypothetical protein G7Y89_g11279 [Cudoniella acicularis]|uniref:Methyltransferase n=1 Tax=Cudoniella acicularis TaxID=354080 RepID=A0A8H4RDT0_9HELO|nr:hypothetical protein G7Y89_g11279 [Cudoniella acicularis]